MIAAGGGWHPVGDRAQSAAGYNGTSRKSVRYGEGGVAIAREVSVKHLIALGGRPGRWAVAYLSVMLVVALVAVGCSSAAKTPTAGAPVGPKSTYRIGLVQDPGSINVWGYNGATGSAWDFYLFNDSYPSLYTYSVQRFDWVPYLAADFPTPLQEEKTGGSTYWTTTVKFKKGFLWSDGQPVTSEDLAFTVGVAKEFKLPSSWVDFYANDVLYGVDNPEPDTAKLLFTKKPGLAQWQFGAGFGSIVSKRYWEPIVNQARKGADPDAKRAILTSYVPTDEPTAGAFLLKNREKGKVIDLVRNPRYFFQKTKVTLYANGAYREEKPGGYTFTAYGDPKGQVQTQFTIGPYFDNVQLRIYDGQESGVRAVEKGEIDLLTTPLGLPRGIQAGLAGKPGIATVLNPGTTFAFVGFNIRRAPMGDRAFRQAVATLIDKEALGGTILQGAADPSYNVVSVGDKTWHNPNVAKGGQGLTRQQRVDGAVKLLKGAGYTFEQEPKLGSDGEVAEPAKGLRMPGGKPVPAMTMLSPDIGYDPLRATAALWVERWLNDMGIPVRAKLMDFNAIPDQVYVNQDFDLWILGETAGIFPVPLADFFQSSRSGKGDNNPGGYSNPEYDKIADAFLAQTTVPEAKDLAFRLQAMVSEDLPVIPMVTYPVVEAYRSDRVVYPFTDLLDGLQSLAGMNNIVKPK